MEYKSLSFRLNLDDVEERQFYEKIVHAGNSFTSISAFLKYAVEKYFKEEEIKNISTLVDSGIKHIEQSIQASIKKEIEQQGTALLGGLLSAMGSAETRTETNKIKVSELPKEVDEFPEKLNDVLTMFE